MDKFPYIADISDETREKEAIHRFFCVSAGNVMDILAGVGIRYAMPYYPAIFGVRIPYNYIDHSLAQNAGDIDVVTVPLCGIDGVSGTAKFVPDYNYIVGIEVKAPYGVVSAEHAGQPPTGFPFTLKGAGLGSSHKNRWKIGSKLQTALNQSRRLVPLGFDRVLLLYIVSTKPQDKEDKEVAFPRSYNAAGMASHFSIEAVKYWLDKAVENRAIKTTDQFGITIFGSGTVAGKVEPYRGAYRRPLAYKHSPRIRNASKFRTTLIARFKELIPEPFQPSVFPVTIRACSDNKAKHLILWHPRHGESCPECGCGLL